MSVVNRPDHEIKIEILTRIIKGRKLEDFEKK
jgi:hypothetical protein